MLCAAFFALLLRGIGAKKIGGQIFIRRFFAFGKSGFLECYLLRFAMYLIIETSFGKYMSGGIMMYKRNMIVKL